MGNKSAFPFCQSKSIETRQNTKTSLFCPKCQNYYPKDLNQSDNSNHLEKHHPCNEVCLEYSGVVL